MKVGQRPLMLAPPSFLFASLQIRLCGRRHGHYICGMAHPSVRPSQSTDRPNVLLTGFGPFPGVPVNVSAGFAAALADAAGARFAEHAFHSAVLATEWRQAPVRIEALYAELAPVLALHFGVAQDTAAIRLERLAHNTCRMSEDAIGLLPLGPALVSGGNRIEEASLPLEAIYQRLSSRAVPVAFSDDAGGYLCNAVLYHSLSHARAQQSPSRVGFIHLPDSLARPSLSFSVALEAALEIIDVALSEGA